MSEEKPKKKWYKYLINRYVIVGLAFAIWMTFFDQNSYRMHQDLDMDLERLEEEKVYFNNVINEEEEALEKLKSSPEAYEKIARERFLMKRENEDIFVIEKEDTVSYE